MHVLYTAVYKINILKYYYNDLYSYCVLDVI